VRIARNSVNDVVEELPTLRETARGVTVLLSELKGIKSNTLSIRNELFAILEMVTRLTNLHIHAQQPTDGIDEDLSNHNFSSKLKALRKGVENLSVRLLG